MKQIGRTQKRSSDIDSSRWKKLCL